MRKDVNITGVGIVSALGENLENHKKNLFSKETGIHRKKFTNGNYTLNSYVGQVENISSIPNKYKNHSKKFKMTFSAFDEAIRSANLNEDVKFKRVAICLGTSLVGNSPGENAFNLFKNGEFNIPKDFFEEGFLHALVDELIAHYGLTDASYYVISTACSASNNAVILGTQLLQDDKCDIAICGGCDELHDISLAGFSSLGAINKNDACHPYSSGQGISLGEGAGFVILEKNRPRGFGKVLTGSITSDGYHITAPKPTGEGAIQVAQNISSKSNVSLNKIDYVNGHGTGTKANDSMEKSMFDKIFPKSTKVSSTKGSTGHTLGAAGIVEIINCILAMQENKIPATKTEYINDNDRFVRYYNLNKRLDYVMNFSFAFGGNNSGVLLVKDDTPENTHFISEKIKTSILSYASTLESSDDKKNKYELIKTNSSKILGLRYIDSTRSSKVNPSQFRKMDHYTKMVANTVSKAIERSGLDFKKINSNKVGILFSTSLGPLEVTEDIATQVKKCGYTNVSAGKFPFTVMNAAAGMLSILFGIKGAVSVISSNTGFIDGAIYAEEMMKNEDLECIILVSANQWTEYSLFALDQLGYDGNVFLNADYCQAVVVSPKYTEGYPQILCSEQLKYDNKNNSKEHIKNKISSCIQQQLNQLGLNTEEVKKVIWNSNKKTNAVEYDILDSFDDILGIKVNNYNLGFSSDGCGEELSFILDSDDFSSGIYIIISYSHFGGVSFMMLQK